MRNFLTVIHQIAYASSSHEATEGLGKYPGEAPQKQKSNNKETPLG